MHIFWQKVIHIAVDNIYIYNINKSQNRPK